MSFFSYKNGNSEMTPGCITGNPCQGLTERICIQVKNVLFSSSYSIPKGPGYSPEAFHHFSATYFMYFASFSSPASMSIKNALAMCA